MSKKSFDHDYKYIKGFEGIDISDLLCCKYDTLNRRREVSKFIDFLNSKPANQTILNKCLGGHPLSIGVCVSMNYRSRHKNYYDLLVVLATTTCMFTEPDNIYNGNIGCYMLSQREEHDEMLKVYEPLVATYVHYINYLKSIGVDTTQLIIEICNWYMPIALDYAIKEHTRDLRRVCRDNIKSMTNSFKSKYATVIQNIGGVKLNEHSKK